MKASAVAAVGGVSLVGAVGLLALLSGGRRAPVMVSLSGTARDEEAIARMLASENPSGSVALWLEQIWTQIRSAVVEVALELIDAALTTDDTE